MPTDAPTEAHRGPTIKQDSVFISSQMEKLDIVSRLLMVNFADLQMSLQHVHVHARSTIMGGSIN